MAYASVNSRSLETDPRWLEMIKRYSGDITRFAIEVAGVQPSEQQITFFQEVQKAGCRVSVSSGHGTGKTMAISIIALHHLTMFFQSICLITANDMAQLLETIFKEVSLNAQRIRRGRYAWLYDYIEILADGSLRIRGHEQTWTVNSKTSDAKSANKMAGRHGKHFLIICDEASTIPDEVFQTLTGALTEKYNKMILTSQMTRNAGYFWRSQFELCRPSGEWVALRFSSYDSPFVSEEALRRMNDEYEDDEKAVRLLGLPPTESGKFFMSLMDAMKMYTYGQIIREDEPYGWGSSADIASGEGERDKSALVIAKVIGRGLIGPESRRVEVIHIPYLTNKIKSNVFANHIVEESSQYSNVTNVIDSGGLGINVCQDVEDMNKIVHRVNWGSPCFQKLNKERYLNLRAQATYYAARAAKEGRLSIRTLDHKRAMLRQASGIPKEWTDARKMRVPPKHGKAWEGRGSPDLFDAVCFFFLENFHYIPANKDGFIEQTATKSVLDVADEYFAGVH
jgi:hypothetical protein